MILPAVLVAAEPLMAVTLYTNTDSEFIVRRNSGTATVEVTAMDDEGALSAPASFSVGVGAGDVIFKNDFGG